MDQVQKSRRHVPSTLLVILKALHPSKPTAEAEGQPTINKHAQTLSQLAKELGSLSRHLGPRTPTE